MSAGAFWSAPSVGEALAAKYRAAGLPCEIEAGPRGLIVYASTRVDAARVAGDIANAARERDPHARAVPPEHDDSGDEPPATAWWAAVEFDWRRF